MDYPPEGSRSSRRSSLYTETRKILRVTSQNQSITYHHDHYRYISHQPGISTNSILVSVTEK